MPFPEDNVIAAFGVRSRLPRVLMHIDVIAFVIKIYAILKLMVFVVAYVFGYIFIFVQYYVTVAVPGVHGFLVTRILGLPKDSGSVNVIFMLEILLIEPFGNRASAAS